MDSESIREQQSQIVERWGEWTTGFQIADGAYTQDNPEAMRAAGIRLRRIMQVAADVAGQPLDSLRVLDLGCLEGLFALEFARHGAEVVGIEGRVGNIEKARFVQRMWSLDRLRFIMDDVRNLRQEKHGCFDVVLCLGILYHLNTPDLFQFVERMAEVCQGCVIIDTHISLQPVERRTYNGHEYWGTVYGEHSPSASTADRLKNAWASLDNTESFWLTRPSLYNLLERTGFSSVYECHNPRDVERPGGADDRITLVARKGDPVQLVSIPLINGLPAVARLEVSKGALSSSASPLRGFGGRLPGPVKEYLKQRTR